MGRKLAVGIAVVASGLLAGCGSSQSSSQGFDPVARAADVTAAVPGYRIAATINVGTAAGPAHMTVSGLFDRASRTGTMTAEEAISGRRLQFTEVFSRLTFYLQSADLSALKQLTGGKHWLKFDMSRMLGSLGLGSLPTTGTDPTQFVDFLRAVSSSTKRLGTETVRGASTTHYHAIVDLDRYPKLLPAADRAAAATGVSTLESALGSHMMPIDAWIDHSNLVRRVKLAYSECVANQHIQFGMTMDLYDYGPQQQPQLPPTSDVYDLTPLLTSALSKIKFGCTGG